MPYGSENEGRGLDDRPIKWAPPCLRPKEKSPIPFIPWRTCQTWLISLDAFVCFLPGLSSMIGGGKKVMCTSEKFNFPSIVNYGRKCFNVKKKKRGGHQVAMRIRCYKYYELCFKDFGAYVVDTNIYIRGTYANQVQMTLPLFLYAQMGHMMYKVPLSTPIIRSVKSVKYDHPCRLRWCNDMKGCYLKEI